MKDIESKEIAPEVTRRDFIKTAGAGLFAAPYIASGWAQTPPSDMVRHAVIGTGGMGRNHTKNFGNMKGCSLVAICDVDPAQLGKAFKDVPNADKIQKFSDFRELLKDKSIDSVSIAAPDHWHTPMALWAMMAGKHVYVEKPCAHNIKEVNLLVKASKSFNKCVQHGTQRRSNGAHIEGMKQLRNGIIGKVHTIKAIDHQYRESIGKAVAEAPPAGVDYDMWLGAAPKVPFTKNRWHYNWRWFWDYGNGDAANDGVHQIDVAVWALGDRYPKRVISSGAQYFYKDDHETPDTQTTIFEYDDTQIIWEMRLWTDYTLEGHDNGNVAYGTEGKMEFDRAGVIVTKGKEQIKIEAPEAVEAIMPNFITAVRENNPAKLNSPIEKGAIATNMALLANITTRLGAPSLQYDPVKEEIKCPGMDKQANAMLSRTYRKGYELPWKG
ncbi:Gfo/Idh/MocA family protein [Dyadobacter luticola]|uniref:Gfo/Idh/MocA family oxidoreductase n=1 Tax=Dyadobacter luticola TaxID=1979387 RepID=A0A5R9KWE4_9BACT|nr:Gfo/Idh/MocA family oxidoreductase [Dyadobacter luticola]TLV00419.1 Gfo/Idh/MocA family oxidoreductase [Dyadobacter luticola]